MAQPTMSEARRYQQLREHLGYLKLNDAAEALPRVLDAARPEQLSVTAALDRLIEIEVEVEATEARRLASRLRFPAYSSRGPSATSTSPPSPAWTRS